MAFKFNGNPPKLVKFSELLTGQGFRSNCCFYIKVYHDNDGCYYGMNSNWTTVDFAFNSMVEPTTFEVTLEK